MYRPHSLRTKKIEKDKQFVSGMNKLTVVTPDKKLMLIIEIDKTIIPDWSKY